MFMHDFNDQLTKDRMHTFDAQAAQHRLGTHAGAAKELNHTPKRLLHNLLAAGTAAGTLVFLITQTAPRIGFG